MTEREKLIELIERADNECRNRVGCDTCKAYGRGKDCLHYLIADHLLSNGVIVPPCKVGDTVFEFSCDDPFLEYPNYYVVPSTVCSFIIFTTEDMHNMDCVGKTVFLTKEEAEKALKERSEGKADE